MKVASLASSLYQALGSRAARVLGLGLSLVLTLLVCRALYLEWGRLAQMEIDRDFLLAATASVCVVVLGNLLGSVASWLLLRRQATTISLPFFVTVNGLAQLAKYLPGNVLHLVGRFILVKERTDAKVALALSIYELLLLCLSGSALGLLYVHYLQPDTWPLPALALLSVATLGVGVLVLRRLAFLQVTTGDLAAVVALYLLSYLAYGFAFSLLFSRVADLHTASALLCAVLFALAFVVGYVTPGASGGLGVREFVFMMLAQPILDSTLAVTVVVLFRFFSVAGDLVFALAAFGVKRFYGVKLVGT
jgi:glycosyltransferase 2 family protein